MGGGELLEREGELKAIKKNEGTRRLESNIPSRLVKHPLTSSSSESTAPGASLYAVTSANANQSPFRETLGFLSPSSEAKPPTIVCISIGSASSPYTARTSSRASCASSSSKGGMPSTLRIRDRFSSHVSLRE